MIKELLKTKSPPHRGKILNQSSLSTFDFPLLIEKIKKTHAWVNGELSSVILLRTADKQMVLAVLHADTVIKSFQSSNSVTIQIIEGKLKFHTPKESVNLLKGQLFTLSENVSYNLITKVETILLLTILSSVLQPAEF